MTGRWLAAGNDQSSSGGIPTTTGAAGDMPTAAAGRVKRVSAPMGIAATAGSATGGASPASVAVAEAGC